MWSESYTNMKNEIHDIGQKGLNAIKGSGFVTNEQASSNALVDKSIGILFLAYIGYMALGELINASVQFTGIIGTLTDTVIPIIIAIALVQIVKGRK